MKLSLLILILCPLTILGQINENFNDGDFSSNPKWFGNTNQFIINENLQLQLHDIEAGEAWLSCPQSISDSIEWCFTTKLSFSPSSNNNSRIYLVCDTENPIESTSSVYLQLGESGSDDAPELYCKDEFGTHSILRSSEALVNSSFEYRWKISYSNTGTWKLYYSPHCNEDYILLATQYKQINFCSQYFSVYCKYTISNASKFYFDDIVVRHILKDFTPPQVVDLKVQDSTTLRLYFDESLDPESILLESFTLDPVNEHPILHIYDPFNKSIQIKFNFPFQANYPYQLQCIGIRDIEGNIIEPIVNDFTYFPPYSCQYFDVVIHELMSDINPPPIDLPPYDYLELYNRLDHEIDLSKFKVQFGASEKVFPRGTTIQANDFLIITDEESGLDDYGHTCLLSSLNLNNECLITLKDSLENLIHYVEYDKTWYRDTEKAKGGWSLEMINPNFPCNLKENWIASSSLSGGTPGTLNTINEMNPDTTPPSILSIKNLDNNTLELIFGECLHPTDSTPVINILPGNYSPYNIQYNYPLNNSYVLEFENEFVGNKTYTLQIKSDIEDCSGNIAKDIEVDFINYQAQHLDLLITEFMYDPEPIPNHLPPVEYVELFNNSNFPINVKDWTIQFSNKHETIIQNHILKPNEYLLLCEDEFQEINNVPVYGLSISNSGGILALYSDRNNLIHHVNWSPEWMDEEWKSEGGWSLEMIDINTPCSGNINWTASTNYDGGTPGIENSVIDEIGDYYAPNLNRVSVISKNRIRLDFNEEIFIPSIFTNKITVANHQINNITYSKPIPKQLIIEIDPALNENKKYNLKIHNQLCDCAGNEIETTEIVFGIPNQQSTKGLIINEVLFDSYEKNGDFIELYNNSDSFLELRDVIIEIKGKEPYRISEDVLQLQPYEYFILCNDYEKISSYYYCDDMYNYIESKESLELHKDSGFVKIYDQEMVIIDQMQYTESMHHPSILDPKGISLERINFDIKGIQKSNWHSASSTSGWATPGKENSQMSNQNDMKKNDLDIVPKTFSPNNDGFEDYTTLRFHCENPGYLAHIRIFNNEGDCVRFLQNNILCSIDNSYNWDGKDENGNSLPEGFYIILISLLSPEGKQSFLKTSCALHYTNRQQ